MVVHCSGVLLSKVYKRGDGACSGAINADDVLTMLLLFFDLLKQPSERFTILAHFQWIYLEVSATLMAEVVPWRDTLSLNSASAYCRLKDYCLVFSEVPFNQVDSCSCI
jgi:hypothetical protein